MARKTEEIRLVFDFERFRFSADAAIVECSTEPPADAVDTDNLRSVFDVERVAVKVSCPPGELDVGLTYRFYGHWASHPRYGRQFVAKTFVEVQPHGRGGVIRYLTMADHVGTVTATALWEHFQGNAVKTLRENPELAAAMVPRFTVAHAIEASEFLKQKKNTEDSTIELMDLFGGRGFPKSLAKKCITVYGNKAAQIIRDDPYTLIEFHGVGFSRCDQLYLDLGHDPDAMRRQSLCAWDAIASDTDGHTWYPPKKVVDHLRQKISGTAVKPVEATSLAISAGMLSVIKPDDSKHPWLAVRHKQENESAVASRVEEWKKAASHWPQGITDGLSLHQAEKLQTCLSSPLSLLTGGPGTGKTYSAVKPIAAAIKKYGEGCIAVAAPTGKAAVRITEAMDSYGLAIKATTIHTLLEVGINGDSWTFARNEKNPLQQKYIVIDEASMLDTDLMSSLCRACGKGAHLLLVGDTAQLPPVGHGAPLRDLIAGGIPNGELTEIRRNSGRIVTTCHAIRNGQAMSLSPVVDMEDPDYNLSCLQTKDGAASIEKIIATISKVTQRDFDPFWDVQVIVAVNAKSPLSRHTLNKRLQGELNPTGHTTGGSPFRVSDKVICLRNSWSIATKDCPEGYNQYQRDEKVFVANGEQGGVIKVEPKITTVRLTAPLREVKIPRGKGNPAEGDTGCNWDLAYAISCHKSQGSEWPVVIVALDEYPGARMVCSREWLYTAISRAKHACFMVGKPDTARNMTRRQAIKNRKTFLAELIRE